MVTASLSRQRFHFIAATLPAIPMRHLGDEVRRWFERLLEHLARWVMSERGGALAAPRTAGVEHNISFTPHTGNRQ